MAQLKLLFVCVENSNRSQMAEGFARHHGGDSVLAASAGSNPSGVINPKALAAMKRKGIDISGQKSEGLDKMLDTKWDWVITMGCGDRCPHVPAQNRDDWELDDPKHLDEPGYDEIRDEIERRVLALIGSVDL